MNKFFIVSLLLCINILHTQDITIVPYDRSRDLEAIQTIIHDNWDILTYEALGSPKGTTQKYLDSSNYITYVLRLDDKTIGFVNYTAYDVNVCTFHYGRYGLIHLLGVDAQYQGQGYGTKLLHYALNDLTNTHVSHINVAVKRDNLRAIELYKKNKFTYSIKPELAARLPKDIPLIMTFDTGVPFDTSRGNIMQRYPKLSGVLCSMIVLGSFIYLRTYRLRIHSATH